VKTSWLALLALLPSLAAADPPSPPPRAAVITNPDWIRTPGPTSLSALYPVLAMRAHVGGAARLECVVTAEGLLVNCQVLSETPEGYGFGQAAINISSLFRMRPQTRDGHPVGGAIVVIPLRFQLPADPPPPPATPQADQGLSGPATPPLSIGGNSYWEETPTDFGLYYPDRAQRMNRNGEASLKCVVTDEGRLRSCEVISENPEDFGFGQAGLEVSKLFKMHPTTTEGRPVGGASVVMRMRFVPPPAEPILAPPPKP
jgi:TonB family protein